MLTPELIEFFHFFRRPFRQNELPMQRAFEGKWRYESFSGVRPINGEISGACLLCLCCPIIIEYDRR